MKAISPDVYIFVADCLRADAYPPGGSEPTATWPRGNEFVKFPRTVSTSSWTLPAHVSVLSGLSPEQHRIHRLGGSRVPSELPWLPTLLRRKGYRTLLLSANHTLSPESGFDRDFDEMAWGRWGENALRLSGSRSPPYSSERPAERDAWKQSILNGENRRYGRAAARAVANLPRFPWLLDASARLARKVRLPGDGNLEVTPWIEPTFRSMVARAAPGTPILALINLMDCHEPYLPSVLEPTSFWSWLRAGRIRQDRTNWTYRAWPYTEDDLAVLRRLYSRQALLVGRRVGRLLRILELAGQLDSSLVVVTSDHGQALGEHQRLFHNGGVSEPEVRVPLWIRFPNGRRPEAVFPDWTSLVDIYPTIAAELALPADFRHLGVALGRPAGNRRRTPAIALADGIFTPKEYSTVGDLCRWSASVAAYGEEYKVIVDSTSLQPEVFNIRHDPHERQSLPEVCDGRIADLAERARGILRTLEMPLSRSDASMEVERRLGSWGYLT